MSWLPSALGQMVEALYINLIYVAIEELLFASSSLFMDLLGLFRRET